MTDFVWQGYSPMVRDSYPRDATQKIVSVEFMNDLHLARAKSAVFTEGGRETEYITTQSYSVRAVLDSGQTHVVTVPKGMLTDLASVPKWARAVIGRVGPHLEAAIIHDFLFIAWQDEQTLEDGGRGLDTPPPRKDHFRFANRIFFSLMMASGVPAWKCWLAWAAVSTSIGWRTYREAEPEPKYVICVPDHDAQHDENDSLPGYRFPHV